MCQECERTPEQKTELGKMFGYPKCCIDEFISDTKIMDDGGIDPRIPEQIEIAKFTYGFVPCKKHALAISSGEIELDSIIVGRNKKKIKKYYKKHQ